MMYMRDLSVRRRLTRLDRIRPICYRSALSGTNLMAKQQRANSRSSRSKLAEAAVSSGSGVLERNHGPHAVPNPVAPPAPRPGHAEAVALYAAGLAAPQSPAFSRASALCRPVLTRYAEERELHDRVRLYLNVCERHMTPRAASPTTPQERVFAATLAVNAARYDEALEHLRDRKSTRLNSSHLVISY